MTPFGRKKYCKSCARNHDSVSKARYKLCAQDRCVQKALEKLCAQPRDQLDDNYPILYHTSVRTPHAKACLGNKYDIVFERNG